MKKSTLAISFVFAILFIGACGNNAHKSEIVAPAETIKEQYQCPMKCTEEVSDKPGKCPVCEMELEKITKS